MIVNLPLQIHRGMGVYNQPDVSFLDEIYCGQDGVQAKLHCDHSFTAQIMNRSYFTCFTVIPEECVPAAC